MYRALLFLTLVVSAVRGEAAETTDPFPAVASSYVVQVRGATLWAHHPDRRRPPASLTKAMTALLVLERGNLDDVVSVSKSAAAETGARLGLRAGDRVRVKDLLAAMLLQSANDACHALADHVGGSESRFVTLMNRRSEDLGLTNTRFANACGHDQPGNFTSARDLALFTDASLKNAEFRKIVALKRLTIRTADGKRVFRLHNKNRLIGRYEGAIGVKTGSTRQAGECLIALAERDGVRVLVVLLDTRDRWRDAPRILDRAFASVGRGKGSTAP